MGALDSQERLTLARAANRPGSSVPHTVVVLPSYSVSSSLLARYGQRITALEHRQLLTMLRLPLVPRSEIIFVTAKLPEERELEYYLSFVPPDRRDDTRARIQLLEIPDQTPRSITAKLLDRPDLMARIRSMTRGRLAYIEPWNVTDLEMAVAHRLGLPLNGTPPSLWPLGFKSNGRRLMGRAGVPLPLGQEDVRNVADVLAATKSIRRQHASAAGVVIKLDNSGTGDGNRVVRFADASTAAELQAAVESLEPWYLSDLASGAVVEELVTGHELSSPSVQVDIAPGRRVEVIATHQQLLGGSSGHVYVGCRFPANPGYGDLLTSYGAAVGKLLAEQGAMGRVCVDFAAARSASLGWQLYGLEINLRKSGTSHPLSLLQNLVPATTTVPRATGGPRMVPSAATARLTTSSSQPGAGAPPTTSSAPFVRPGWSSTLGPGSARSSTCSSVSRSTVRSDSRQSAAHPATSNGFIGPLWRRSRRPHQWGSRGCWVADWSSSMEFVAEAASLSRVRRFVVTELIAHGPVRLADVVAVVGTELATNALLHARPPFEVTLGCADSRLVLGVRDGSSIAPQLSETSDLMRVSRYGIAMVIHMSVEWGVTLGVAGSKTVWAAFDTRFATHPA